MIFKTTSVKQVIAKVLVDNDMQEESHRIADMLTWCGEAIEKIGYFGNLDTKVTGKDSLPLLTITNYQVALPAGLNNIIQVAYSETESGPFYPMRYGTGSFDYNKGTTVATTVNGTTTYSTTEESGSRETNFSCDYNYVITPGYIKVNKPSGYIMMAYTSMPMDAEGYPLVPDDISYIEALYWYVNMKLHYPAWKEGRIRDAVYYDMRRSWNFYCKQAYGNALMPNADMMESIKNTWNRMIVEFNDNRGFYSTTGQQQLIYNSNSNYGKGQINV